MGLRTLGLVLAGVGIAGLAVGAMAGLNNNPLFFTIEASVALVAGMTCLVIGGLRHGDHRRPLGAPPGAMNVAQAIDPKPAAAGGNASR